MRTLAQSLAHCLENANLLCFPKHQAQQGCLSLCTGLARGRPAARSPLTLCVHSFEQLRPLRGPCLGRGLGAIHPSLTAETGILPLSCSLQKSPWSAGPRGVLCLLPNLLTELWVAWSWEPHGGPTGGLPAAEGTIRQEGEFPAGAGGRLGLSYRAASWLWERLLALSPMSPGPGSKGAGGTPLLGDTAGQVPLC